MTNSTPVEDIAQTQTEGAQGSAFRLPPAIADDPELSRLYWDSVARLRAESDGIPMHTVQEFLLERIATGYVLMLHRERGVDDFDEIGDPAVRARLRTAAERNEKDATDQWLNMVKEWNRVLAAGHEKLRDAVLREVEQISLEALELIEDDETRKRLRLHFKERFAALGY